MTNQFEVDFYENFYRLKRYLENRALVLGGIIGSGGGTGGPPGGFIGWLPQSRVAYDLSELATDYTPPSGASLVDNLNHIRYLIANISGAGGISLEVQNSDITVLEDVGIINFEGDVTVTDEGLGKVTVAFSGSGGADEKVKITTNDTTEGFLESKVVAGDNVTVTVLNPGANEQLEINANITVSGGGTLTVEEDNVEVATLIGTINFSGDVSVTDDGGGQATITVLPSGSGLLIKDGGVEIASNITTLNFAGGAEVTDDGANQVTITVSGGGTSDLLSSIREMPVIWTECIGTSSYSLAPFSPVAVGSGTVAIDITVASVNHPGVLAISNTTTGGSGYMIRNTTASQVLLPGVRSEAIFRFTQISPGETYEHGWFGFFDGTSSTNNYNCGMVWLLSGDIKGAIRVAAGAVTYTSTSYAISADTWYRACAEVNSDATGMLFSLYNSDTGALLWSEELVTTLPTTGLYFGSFIHNFEGVARSPLGYLDFMAFRLGNSITR